MKRLASVAALLGSVTTIFCCFLPALFVTLGAGAAFASLLGTFPQLVWLSEHKSVVFGGGALLLLVAGVLQWRARYTACPIDPSTSFLADLIDARWVSIDLSQVRHHRVENNRVKRGSCAVVEIDSVV